MPKPAEPSRTRRFDKDTEMNDEVSATPAVRVREVGLRDGLQMVRTILSTGQKLEWCRRMVEAGVRDIEVTSFVPPKIVPQFADAVDVARGAIEIAGLHAAALVPNLKGAQRAFDVGVQRCITCSPRATRTT